MKLNTFFYNIGQGFKGVFRNRVMTTASILVLMACMVLVGTFYLVIDTINMNFQKIQNLNVIEVMLSKDYDTEQVVYIGEKLAEICDDSNIIDWSAEMWDKNKDMVPNHENFKYLSADDHLQIMLETYDDEFRAVIEGSISHAGHEGENDGVGDALYDNPLRASYRMTFVNLSDFDEVTRVKNLIDEIAFVDETGVRTDAIATDDIKDNIELYGNVMSIKNTMYIVGLWLMAIFLIISLFVIMNTIKLGLAARENEIRFMRLCGATKHFIRMPFMVEGIIIGVVSAAASFGIEFYLYDYLLKDIISSATGTSGTVGIESAEFITYAPILAITFLAIGLFAGVIASGISMKKFLKA